MASVNPLIEEVRAEHASRLGQILVMFAVSMASLKARIFFTDSSSTTCSLRSARQRTRSESGKRIRAFSSTLEMTSTLMVWGLNW